MIGDPIQTSRALLTWQRPLDAGEPRDRHSVGELTASPEGMRFRYLSDEELAPARALGFEGYPGLPLESYQGAHRVENVEAVFMRRLPPVGRSDFAQFMTTFGLSPSSEFAPLSLLAYTGARLTSDSFGIAETFDGFNRPFDYVFDVAGYRRYRENAVGMEAGDPVQLQPEAANPTDPGAVQILNERGLCLGYINRTQTAAVRDWLNGGEITASVYRFNGRPDYPRLFLMTRVSPELREAAA